MASRTSICNKALRKLSKDSIIDIDTDTSREANLCRSSFDEVLEEVLRDFNWNFSIFRQVLNEDITNVPAYGFSRRFVLPTIPKFLKLISIKDNIEYKVEQNSIVTNEESVSITYIGLVTDPNKYDPIFVQALSSKLANEISYSLTSDKALVASTQAEYISALQRAKDINYQDNMNIPIQESAWIDSRFTSRGFNIKFSPIEDA
jgi:hypothetical protein